MTYTFTLTDGIEFVEQQIKAKEDELEQAETKLERADGWPQPLYDKTERIESEISALEGQAEVLERKKEEWGEDAVFVIREVTFNELMQARDKVQNKEGAYNSEVLDLGVEKLPDAVDADHPGDLSYNVGQFLYDIIDDVNTSGDLTLGN